MYNNSSTDIGSGITDGVTGIDEELMQQRAAAANIAVALGSSGAEAMADFATAANAFAVASSTAANAFASSAVATGIIWAEGFRFAGEIEIKPPDQGAGFVCVHQDNDTWLPRGVYESRRRQQWRVSRAGQRAPWPGRRPKRGREDHAGGSQFHKHRRRR